MRLIFCIMSCLALASCGSGQETITTSFQKTDKEMIKDGYIDLLQLSATEGEVEMLVDTYLKTSTVQSGSLAPTAKCKVTKGTKLAFNSLGNEKENHIYIVLKDKPKDCEFNAGYFYKTHVTTKVIPVYSVTVKQTSLFKTNTNQSSQLSSNQKCNIAPGKYYLTSLPVAESNHYKVTLKPNQLSCGFTTGYLYSGHLEEVRGSDGDFAKVIRHILVWEGGCSDDPYDYGGRTYKGITTARARQNGFTADVCTMPDWMVLDIYKKDYWNTRAYKFVWPLNLAVMNTEVNSGGGRAQQFLDRMRLQNIQGTDRQKASWFVDQQINFYYAIVANDSTQNRFLAGWLNRSNYMKDVILDRQSFALDQKSIDLQKTAKTSPL